MPDKLRRAIHLFPRAVELFAQRELETHVALQPFLARPPRDALHPPTVRHGRAAEKVVYVARDVATVLRIGGKGGGGSVLTPKAKEFLHDYETYRDACIQSSRELYTQIFSKYSRNNSGADGARARSLPVDFCSREHWSQLRHRALTQYARPH